MENALYARLSRDEEALYAQLSRAQRRTQEEHNYVKRVHSQHTYREDLEQFASQAANRLAVATKERDDFVKAMREKYSEEVGACPIKRTGGGL